MARFYLDHDVGLLLARLLNEFGHDATTSRTEQTTALRDSAHLLHATRDARTILTHNQKDFVELHHAWCEWTNAWEVSERHSGVIVIPQNSVWTLRRIAHEVDDLMNWAGPMENRLFRWTPERGWFEE